MKHHDDALDRFVGLAADDPEIVAVVVAGSVARGTERADSDVDLYVVVTDDAYDRAFAADRIMYVSDRDVDYPGGYFDVKLITVRMLERARASADDPMRASLRGARTVHSRVDDLDRLLAEVAEPTAAEFDAKVASFLAQARLHGGYFFVQGVAHDDPLLTAHAAVHLAFAAGRALLASQGVLFSGPKYLFETVASLPDAPPGFADALVRLVRDQTPQSAELVLSTLEEHLGDRLSDDATLSTFVRDNELAWYTRVAPPEYR